MDFVTPYQCGNRDGFSGRRPQKQRMCDGFEYWRGYQDGKRERASLAASIAKAFSSEAGRRALAHATTAKGD